MGGGGPPCPCCLGALFGHARGRCMTRKTKRNPEVFGVDQSWRRVNLCLILEPIWTAVRISRGAAHEPYLSLSGGIDGRCSLQLCNCSLLFDSPALQRCFQRPAGHHVKEGRQPFSCQGKACRSHETVIEFGTGQPMISLLVLMQKCLD